MCRAALPVSTFPPSIRSRGLCSWHGMSLGKLDAWPLDRSDCILLFCGSCLFVSRLFFDLCRNQNSLDGARRTVMTRNKWNLRTRIRCHSQHKSFLRVLVMKFVVGSHSIERTCDTRQAITNPRDSLMTTKNFSVLYWSSPLLSQQRMKTAERFST